MLRSYRTVLKVACSSALFMACGIAPTYGEKTNEYVVIEQRLPDFFKELAADTGTRIQLSDSARGWIRNKSLTGDVPTILSSLETPLEIDWFEYNNVYFVSKKSEAVTRMVRLGDLRFSDVTEKLESSEFPIERFPIRSVSGGSAIILTGPPRLLAFVEATIESIPEKPNRSGVIIHRGINYKEEVEE